MIHLSSTSVPCSIAEHPVIHDVVDYIEDASKMTYNFVKSTLNRDTGISAACAQSASQGTFAQIRVEIDSINHQLHTSNLQIEVLQRALEISRDAHVTLKARHVELLNCANNVAKRTGHVSLLPQEIISHIASFLYREDEAFATLGIQPKLPHFEWVKAMFCPASERLYFWKDPDNQFRLAGDGSGCRSAAITDGKHPLSIHFNEADWTNSFYALNDSNSFSQHTLLSTTHRWRELSLCIDDHANYCDILSCVAGLPTLTHLSFYYGPDARSSMLLPKWWGGFIKRCGRAGSMCPNLRSAIVPLRCLTTSSGLFSNVLHLQVDLSNNHFISELGSALRDIHHLITLKISFRQSYGAENAKKSIVILPSLKELSICGIAMGVSSLTPAVVAFECKNLQALCAELSPMASQPEPEEMAALLISVNDSFPTLKQLFCHIPNQSWIPVRTVMHVLVKYLSLTSSTVKNDRDALPMVSQSAIRNLSVPANDGRFLLTHLTTLSIPFESDRTALRDLVALSHNRRTNEASTRLLYLKFIVRHWKNTEESVNMIQSLLIHYHDVEIVVRTDWG
ncbi:hypothetical protein BD410DRAFT_879764 [Rickenella mellea]|uniref:Uncharacterized protein n=1 Tax=Rickenella mellea TaxID=50990 RepID=A0A4Y7QHM7_9AGAM|nr:hypothetical protein BD410DRAFT_879764 [Rickenella mellea]